MTHNRLLTGGSIILSNFIVILVSQLSHKKQADLRIMAVSSMLLGAIKQKLNSITLPAYFIMAVLYRRLVNFANIIIENHITDSISYTVPSQCGQMIDVQ